MILIFLIFRRFFIAPMEEDALGGYSQAATTAGLFLGLMGLLLKVCSSLLFIIGLLHGHPLNVAVVYKMRILAWGSLLAVVAGLANIPRAELDIKQILSSVMYTRPAHHLPPSLQTKTSSFLTDRLTTAPLLSFAGVVVLSSSRIAVMGLVMVRHSPLFPLLFCLNSIRRDHMIAADLLQSLSHRVVGLPIAPTAQGQPVRPWRVLTSHTAVCSSQKKQRENEARNSHLVGTAHPRTPTLPYPTLTKQQIDHYDDEARPMGRTRATHAISAPLPAACSPLLPE
jgi:hypothetical protein